VNQYVSGGGPAYINGFGPNVPPFSFLHADQQFRWMYAELELNPAIRASNPQKLTAAQLQPALRWAISQAQASFPTVDLSAMFSDEYQTPFLFEIRHPLQYNRIKAGAYAAFAPGPAPGNYNGYWQWAANAIYNENALLQRYDKAGVMVGVLPIVRPEPGAEEMAALFWSLKPADVESVRAMGLDAWKARVVGLWPECERRSPARSTVSTSSAWRAMATTR